MKHRRYPSPAVLLAAACLLPAAGHAATFSLDGPWYTGSNNGTPSLSDPNSASFDWGTAGSATETAATGSLWTYFSSQSLANDGDSITVSFNATWLGGDAANNSVAFRFGLFDSNGSTVENNLSGTNSATGFNQSLGYFTAVSPGTNNTLVSARDTGGTNPLSTTNDVQLSATADGAGALAADTPYPFSLTVARNSATEFAVSLEANSLSVAPVTTSIANPDFDTFFLLNTPQTNVASIRFSDFAIATVPEPSSVLLVGLGLLAAFPRRRRSTNA